MDETYGGAEVFGEIAISGLALFGNIIAGGYEQNTRQIEYQRNRDLYELQFAHEETVRRQNKLQAETERRKNELQAKLRALEIKREYETEKLNARLLEKAIDIALIAYQSELDFYKNMQKSVSDFFTPQIEFFQKEITVLETKKDESLADIEKFMTLDKRIKRYTELYEKIDKGFKELQGKLIDAVKESGKNHQNFMTKAQRKIGKKRRQINQTRDFFIENVEYCIEDD